MNTAEFLRTALERHRSGHLDEAESLYRKILDAEPGNAGALHLLGALVSKKGHADDAIGLIREALAIEPDNAVARANLAGILFDGDLMDEAARQCEQAVRINPALTEGWYNLGNIRREQGRIDDALSCYGRTLELNPGHAQAHWNNALLLLLKGDYEKGWKEYEWRWKNPNLPTPDVDFPQPLWDGANLEGKVVFLYAEQGHGDAIQFVRFVMNAAARSARIVLGCNESLKRLFENLYGVVDIVTPRTAIPPFTCHRSLMSLPGLFGVTADTIPAAIPYLEADPALVRQWAPRIGRARGLKVGLVWRGNPAQERDRYRSMALPTLGPLLKVPGVSFFSLQKNPTPEDLPYPECLLDLGPELEDYADTAAVIANLDLVISVCTSSAHLAGTMGRPLWVMLSHLPDWRWFLDRDDSPWYPTARLFRQDKPGDWDGVVARMAGELEALARERAP